MSTSWSTLPARYDETRAALHAVAEHILAAARYRAVGRIGLEPVRGGFATPAFDGKWIEVEGTDLVVRTEGGEVEREPITTLRSAGTFVGIAPGLPDGIYPAATPLDLDAGLEVDPDAARAIADWLALGQQALETFMAAHADESPSGPTLWPEHFDLALSMSEVNYGASLGDADHAGPYVYVGPWTRRDGAFWSESFGASRPAEAIGSVHDVLAFFEDGRERAATDVT
jgi:hypothetical protein